MLITRNNYESFFLLYADGELSAQEENAVEVFLAANEDLKTELDMMFAAVLPAEEIMFPHKIKLLKEMPAGIALQEKMLLAIDNELAASDDTLFLSDRELNAAYAVLLLTKSDPSEIIPFPDKRSLYRPQKGNRSVTGFIKGLILAVLLMLIYFIAISLFTGNKYKPAKENNIMAGDTVKNTVLQDIATESPQKPDANNPQDVAPENTVVLRPNEIKKTIPRRDSAAGAGIILKDDNSFPGEAGKDSAAVGVNVILPPTEEKAIKETAPAKEITDANKNVKKKKGFFRKLKDFVEEHLEDLEDADIIIEKNKRKLPPKPPVKTAPVKRPPVIEPVKKPDSKVIPADPET